jgi:hypothetical protein
VGYPVYTPGRASPIWISPTPRAFICITARARQHATNSRACGAHLRMRTAPHTIQPATRCRASAWVLGWMRNSGNSTGNAQSRIMNQARRGDRGRAKFDSRSATSLRPSPFRSPLGASDLLPPTGCSSPVASRVRALRRRPPLLIPFVISFDSRVAASRSSSIQPGPRASISQRVST